MMKIEAPEVTIAPYASSMDQLLAGLQYADLRVRWAVARARHMGLDPQDEFRGLYISDEHVDQILTQELGWGLWTGKNGHEKNGDLDGWPQGLAKARREWEARTHAGREAGRHYLLDELGSVFSLSPLEMDAFLLALAPEIDLRYERLYAYLQDDVTRKRPSVDLLLNLLTDSFAEKLRQRRLFTNEGRLVRSRLLVRSNEAGSSELPLLAHDVRPAGRVVEHLLGQPGLDSRLHSSTQILPTGEGQPANHLPAGLPEMLLRAAGDMPLFAFVGPYGAGKRQAVYYLAQTTNRSILQVNIPQLHESAVGVVEGLRLAMRDGRLLDAILYLTGWDEVLEDGRPPTIIMRILQDYDGILATAGEKEWQPADRSDTRPVFLISFDRPDFEARLSFWQHHLGDQELDLAPVANHFRFTPGQITDAVATARDLAHWRDAPLTRDDLFAASRTHSNQKLSTLATKIRPRYTWEDIVLPADTMKLIREMVNTVQQRPTVYGRWGFGKKLSLGKGANALFAGESGTGKTMAADIIAGVLGLDLYKIDLSSVVSKYIGETEKNLDRIFTEATTSNAILFFDEADAIFGKRSDVKDSHDRYANIETGYLLQRMEAFDGVVILATNLQANMDDAFIRRLHFIIEFPFPEMPDRERIWRVTFPPETPLADDIDFHLLADRYRVAGGNIKNIVVAAAFLAAEEETPVAMRHVLHASRREYQKLGRLINEKLFVV